MKVFFLLSIIFSLFISFTPLKKNEQEITSSLSLNSSYCILMEEKTRHIIYASNENEKLYPASMTKMMGMLLICEALENNKISLEDVVTCSSYASNMGGTQIFLEEGEKMKLKDLLKAVAINSSNDAIVCLGEYLSGTNDNFVLSMNKKAKSLNMNNTHFENATGFDNENHYSSCLDMAILASELLKYKDIILPFSSLKESYIREDTSSPFWLVNTNKLLGDYDGLDGLKTGYTSLAKYNLCATSYRNGIRLISVVMKENSIKERSEDTIALLNYGYASIKNNQIFNKNDIVSKVRIYNTLEENLEVYLKEPANIFLYQDEKIEDLEIKIHVINEIAPIEEDELIGELIIKTKHDVEFKFPLYAKKKVDKLSLLQVFLNNLRLIFS